MIDRPFTPLQYSIGSSTIRVEYADITTLHVDALVSSADIDLSMSGGVSAALLAAGGEDIRQEAQQLAPLRLGDIAATTAGRLHAKQIFHAAVLDYGDPDATTIGLIRKVVRKSLVAADERGLTSIAFPALATGTAQLSPERSATAMTLETSTYLAGQTGLQLVVIALFPRLGLDREILPRFYSQITEFLDASSALRALDDSLEQLERVYEDLKLDEDATDASRSREWIKKSRTRWEQQILKKEPGDIGEEGGWPEYREQTEELFSYLPSDERQVLDIIRNRPTTDAALADAEEAYLKYREGKVRLMIFIRKKNITDIEVELARGGFSITLKRQLEAEQEALDALERELKDLENG